MKTVLSLIDRIPARWRAGLALIAIALPLFSFSGSAAASYVTVTADDPGIVFDDPSTANDTWNFQPWIGSFFDTAIAFVEIDNTSPFYTYGGTVTTAIGGGITNFLFVENGGSEREWAFGDEVFFSIKFTGTSGDLFSNWEISAQIYEGTDSQPDENTLNLSGGSDGGITYTFGVAQAPEPASLALLGLGLAGLGFLRRRNA